MSLRACESVCVDGKRQSARDRIIVMKAGQGNITWGWMCEMDCIDWCWFRLCFISYLRVDYFLFRGQTWVPNLHRENKIHNKINKKKKSICYYSCTDNEIVVYNYLTEIIAIMELTAFVWSLYVIVIYYCISLPLLE